MPLRGCRPLRRRRAIELEQPFRLRYFSLMKRASVTEAKNNLSALIDSLKGGSPVLIVDRGRPVARLEPVARDREGELDGRLSRLFRDGVARPGRKEPARSLFSSPPPPRAAAGLSAVDALIEERREGR